VRVEHNAATREGREMAKGSGSGGGCKRCLARARRGHGCSEAEAVQDKQRGTAQHSAAWHGMVQQAHAAFELTG